MSRGPPAAGPESGAGPEEPVRDFRRGDKVTYFVDNRGSIFRKGPSGCRGGGTGERRFLPGENLVASRDSGAIS